MKHILTMIAAGTLSLAMGASAQQAPADLVKAKNCLTCHDVEKKKVGPAFKDTAAKYTDNKEAEAKLIAALKDGKGHMKVAATDAELKTMVSHVLSTK